MAAQEVLLEEGAPINALDMNKQSALHAAVFLLMDDMVEASDSRLRHLPNGVFPAIKRSFCWMILSNLRRVVSNLVCSDPHETIANTQRDRNSRSLFAQKMLSEKEQSAWQPHSAPDVKDIDWRALGLGTNWFWQVLIPIFPLKEDILLQFKYLTPFRWACYCFTAPIRPNVILKVGFGGVGYGKVRISKSLDLVKSKMYQNDGWLVSSVSVISLDLEYPLVN